MNPLPPQPADAPATREQRFRDMFQVAHPRVLAFVRRRYQVDAEAVVAETFLATWRRFDEMPTDADQRMAWIFATARNCIFNALRADRRRDALAVRAASAPTGLTLEPDQIAARLDLARAWDALAPEAQEALSLAYFEGLDSTSAGTVLGISSTAYRARLSRARHALAERLNSDSSEPADPQTQGASR